MVQLHRDGFENGVYRSSRLGGAIGDFLPNSPAPTELPSRNVSGAVDCIFF
jgi:hypothetical protein